MRPSITITQGNSSSEQHPVRGPPRSAPLEASRKQSSRDRTGSSSQVKQKSAQRPREFWEQRAHLTSQQEKIRTIDSSYNNEISNESSSTDDDVDTEPTKRRLSARFGNPRSQAVRWQGDTRHTREESPRRMAPQQPNAPQRRTSTYSYSNNQHHMPTRYPYPMASHHPYQGPSNYPYPMTGPQHQEQTSSDWHTYYEELEARDQEIGLLRERLERLEVASSGQGPERQNDERHAGKRKRGSQESRSRRGDGSETLVEERIDIVDQLATARFEALKQEQELAMLDEQTRRILIETELRQKFENEKKEAEERERAKSELRAEIERDIRQNMDAERRKEAEWYREQENRRERMEKDIRLTMAGRIQQGLDAQAFVAMLESGDGQLRHVNGLSGMHRQEEPLHQKPCYDGYAIGSVQHRVPIHRYDYYAGDANTRSPQLHEWNSESTHTHRQRSHPVEVPISHADVALSAPKPISVRSPFLPQPESCLIRSGASSDIIAKRWESKGKEVERDDALPCDANIRNGFLHSTVESLREPSPSSQAQPTTPARGQRFSDGAAAAGEMPMNKAQPPPRVGVRVGIPPGSQVQRQLGEAGGSNALDFLVGATNVEQRRPSLRLRPNPWQDDIPLHAPPRVAEPPVRMSDITGTPQAVAEFQETYLATGRQRRPTSLEEIGSQCRIETRHDESRFHTPQGQYLGPRPPLPPHQQVGFSFLP